MSGEFGAVQAGTEQPDRHVKPGTGNGAHGLTRLDGLEIGLQLEYILREPVFAARHVAAQGAGCLLVGARCTAEAEVDAAREQRFEGAELLGDHQRRVIGQHDAAGADTDARGRAGHVRDHHCGGCAGDAGHVVVLGEPVAGVARPVRQLRQFARVAQGVSRRAAGGDGGEIEYGKRDPFGGGMRGLGRGHGSLLHGVEIHYATGLRCTASRWARGRWPRITASAPASVIAARPRLHARKCWCGARRPA